MKNKEFVHDSELNLELQLMTEVMGLESLHYGYFTRTEENATDLTAYEGLTLDQVKAAQGLYTQTLEEFFPQEVRKILDVGCGIGDNAKYFASKGYEVTAISPDANHGKFFDKTIENPRFIQTTIEGLNIDDKFDLILMSESQNYFAIEDGLSQANQYLRDGGFLVISGNFAKNGNGLYETMHSEPIYHRYAEKYGFQQIKRVDITPNILPTLHYTRGLINNHLKPILEVMGGYFTREMPVRSKIAKLFLGGQINRVYDILSYYDDFLEIHNYIEHVNYVRVMYQLNCNLASLK